MQIQLMRHNIVKLTFPQLGDTVVAHLGEGGR